MSGSKSAVTSLAVMSGGKPLGKRIKDNWQLYLMLLIPVILTIIYKYIPMYGIQIAFRDYKASRGMWGSEWIGLEWFERFFTAPTCARVKHFYCPASLHWMVIKQFLPIPASCWVIGTALNIQ